MCFALIVVAMLPLPIVYIARRFNLMSDGSNKLSVSYRKTMMKDISNLEEQDEARFILGAKPGEAPSSDARKSYLTPGGNKPLDPNSLSPNICYGTSYQNAAISPTTPTTPTTPATPESDSWLLSKRPSDTQSCSTVYLSAIKSPPGVTAAQRIPTTALLTPQNCM